jgi:tetratricopeptide (TPR) repeat protein
MDYTAVGQTTHLAARMEQLATPGTVRLTANTLRLAEGFIHVASLGLVPIKGLPAPVEVFELRGAESTRRRLQARAARGLTRFVGREAEVDQLRQALARAQTGHGQVVALVGEPGVGKSRLVYEFTHSHRTQGWLILESSSVSYGKATPYLPVIDLLKAYFQLEDRDDDRKVREKVTGKLFTLDTALGLTLPVFLALLDVPVEDPTWQALDPPQRRQRTLEAAKRLLLRESQVQPLLLVFEDLHWIDAETQALLATLVESVPTARLLLLVNYRPEYQHSWGSKTYYTQLRLDPLPPESAHELLQALVGDDGGAAGRSPLEDLKHLLIARTEGNPFFLEESVRTLVESGVLVGERGAYRLARDLTTIQVPATVQGILAARIDRLPPEQKRLLQTAAVIGTEVPWPLLHAIAELPEEALRRGLSYLQGVEFLYETSLFPELAYAFKHALTHEVAYGSVLHERRRALHARIVEVLEQRGAERLAEQVEQVAHHALRGEVWDKAVAACRQAGTKAMTHSAYPEAVTCFEQALDALQHLPEHPDTQAQAIDLRLDLRNALYPLGELERIRGYLQDASGLAEALGDQARLGWASAYLLNHFFMASEPDRALASGRRALAIATALGDVSLTVVAQNYLGYVCRSLGEYRQAAEYFRKNIESLDGDLLYERLGLPGLASVHARGGLAISLAECGAFDESTAPAEEGIRIAEAADHPYSRAHAYGQAGFRLVRKGDLEQAIPMLERLLDLVQGAQLRLWIPRVASYLGAAYALAGRTAEAVPLLEHAVGDAVALRLPDTPLSLTFLSEAYLLAGRLDEAQTQAQSALEFSRAHKERGHEAFALRLLGEVAAHREPPDAAQAEAYHRQALTLAEELGMRPLLAHCHLGLGTLCARLGRRDGVRELSEAAELYRTMGMTFWLPRAEAALAAIKGHSYVEGKI